VRGLGVMQGSQEHWERAVEAGNQARTKKQRTESPFESTDHPLRKVHTCILR
jgi:hypothetical protein